MSKTCKKCGKELEDNVKFCTRCGTKFKKPWYKKVWVWCIIVLFGICIVSCGSSSSTETTKSEFSCKECGKELESEDICDVCSSRYATSEKSVVSIESSKESNTDSKSEFTVLLGMTEDEAKDYLMEHYSMYLSDIEIIKEHNTEIPAGQVFKFSLSDNKKNITLTISIGPDQETLVEMIKADPITDVTYNDFIRYPSKYAGKYIVIDTSISIKRESILGIGYDVLYGKYDESLIHFEDKREFKEPNFIDGDHLYLYCIVADEPATMKITQADYQSFGIFGGVNYSKTTDTYQIPEFYIVGAEFID